MSKNETLSYCGIYCGGCVNYKENMNCMGCRYEKEMVNDCPTRACAIVKGFLHCGECEDFPCGELDSFYKDGIPHHGQAYKNTLRINEIGHEKWLVEQKKEHICSCGSKKSSHAASCGGDNCKPKI